MMEILRCVPNPSKTTTDSHHQYRPRAPRITSEVAIIDVASTPLGQDSSFGPDYFVLEEIARTAGCLILRSTDNA